MSESKCTESLEAAVLLWSLVPGFCLSGKHS